MFDQPYWGNRLATLGPKPLARHNLTAKQLAERITETLTHTTYTHACQDLARKLAAEPGAHAAAAHISALATQR